MATADRERAVVDAGLAEPAVLEAARTADEPLDLTAAVAARDTAVERADAATRVAGLSAADRLAAAARCGEDVARAASCARESTSARSRAVVRLADVAAGSTSVNPSGITLGTYVLMRRFEDVVAAANDRLRGMLGGRFTLETSEERETGSRARRPDSPLAVHDHTTDTLRAPGSLSGGETFTVSLCLALGLADVVQAEAGGVALGTLFVDEGFGTLDPETLDDVIGQLARLTAGRPKVGIVSHVEELKQRIPERIAVRRTPGGGSRVTNRLTPGRPGPAKPGRHVRSGPRAVVSGASGRRRHVHRAVGRRQDVRRDPRVDEGEEHPHDRAMSTSSSSTFRTTGPGRMRQTNGKINSASPRVPSGCPPKRASSSRAWRA